ncbi:MULTISPECIES: YwdI family protein [unclassified Priestia]|uniref:YwdI family protein n=1 Tax=unclassified Priestia TaxID=2800374 RepID=UPI00366F6479
MDIKMTQLLDKISAEVQKAKHHSNSANVRDQLVAIKALCELALDQNGEVSVSKPVVMSSPEMMQSPEIMQQQIIQSSKPNFEGTKLKSDDANGDSLFDF